MGGQHDGERSLSQWSVKGNQVSAAPREHLRESQEKKA